MKIHFLLGLSLCFGFPLLAADTITPPVQEVTVDAGKSNVRFALGAVLHTVHGQFKVKGGRVRLDVATTRASGQITVDLQSGNTGVQERDRHMHNEVLESARYPEAVFSPDRVTGKFSSEGEFNVSLHGVLRVHGQDHEITVPTIVQVHDGRVVATANFVVPYVKWGMKDPSTFILRVSDNVDVSVKLVGKLTRSSG
ncbi:MAG: YceI family protein [Verrucomicrobia bacterium]|nr:YceI family protein [Verrucomicrobiota bacterium]